MMVGQDEGGGEVTLWKRFQSCNMSVAEMADGMLLAWEWPVPHQISSLKQQNN